METPEIVSHLAQLLRQKSFVEKTSSGKPLKLRESPGIPEQDQVELTQVAAHYAAAGSDKDMEEEQAMKVERLKVLVHNGKYQLDDDTVEQIAGNIAKMFI